MNGEDLGARPRVWQKKPVRVVAVRWTAGTPLSAYKYFTNGLARLDDVSGHGYVYDRLHDVWVPLEVGDWIVKGVKGELYPVKADVFAEIYVLPEADAQRLPTGDVQ